MKLRVVKIFDENSNEYSLKDVVGKILEKNRDSQFTSIDDIINKLDVRKFTKINGSKIFPIDIKTIATNYVDEFVLFNNQIHLLYGPFSRSAGFPAEVYNGERIIQKAISELIDLEDHPDPNLAPDIREKENRNLFIVELSIFLSQNARIKEYINESLENLSVFLETELRRLKVQALTINGIEYVPTLLCKYEEFVSLFGLEHFVRNSIRFIHYAVFTEKNKLYKELSKFCFDDVSPDHSNINSFIGSATLIKKNNVIDLFEGRVFYPFGDVDYYLSNEMENTKINISPISKEYLTRYSFQKMLIKLKYVEISSYTYTETLNKSNPKKEFDLIEAYPPVELFSNLNAENESEKHIEIFSKLLKSTKQNSGLLFYVIPFRVVSHSSFMPFITDLIDNRNLKSLFVLPNLDTNEQHVLLECRNIYNKDNNESIIFFDLRNETDLYQSGFRVREIEKQFDSHPYLPHYQFSPSIIKLNNYCLSIDFLTSNSLKIDEVIFNAAKTLEKEVILGVLVLKFIVDNKKNNKTNLEYESLPELTDILNSFNNDKIKSIDIPYINELSLLLFETISENDKMYNSVLSFISKLKRFNFTDDFSDIFEDILTRLTREEGRVGGYDLWPKEVNELMVYLAEDQPYGSVYNPYAGIGSYGLTNDDQNYIGQEINPQTAAIANLRFLVHNITSSKVLTGDSINDWNPTKDKFDLIISAPPFGLKKNWGSEDRPYKDVSSDVVSTSIGTLNENGRLIIAVTNSFLYSSSSKSLRRNLLENNLLESIISMPENLFQNTGIPFSILVLNKNKSKEGVVRFVDARSFVKEKRKQVNILRVDKLKDVLSLNKDFTTYKGNSELITDRINLVPQRFLLPTINGTRLGELTEIIDRKRINQNEARKIVKVRDLSDDKFNYKLDLNSIQELSINIPTNRIDESCLLIPSRWKTLKPTFFKYEGEPLFISPDIIALRLKDNEVDLAFLINQLHSPKVLMQLQAYQIGSVIPTITSEDLLNIVIEKLNYSEQLAKVSGINDQYVAGKVREAQLLAQEHGLFHEYFKDISDLKHTLGTPLANIGSGINVIKRLIENKEKEGKLVSIGTQVSKLNDYKLLDVFKSIEIDLERISNLLEARSNYLDVTQYHKKPIDVIKLFNAYLKKLEIDYEDVFSLSMETGFMNEYNNNQVFINANKELLLILFDLIVNNAVKHGFLNKGNNADNNEIVFYIGDGAHYNLPNSTPNNTILGIPNGALSLTLEFTNNGVPLPDGFEKPQFIQKHRKAGASGNTGLGGYHVDKITKYFNGDFDLDSDPNSKYPVTLALYFPIIETNITNDEDI